MSDFHGDYWIAVATAAPVFTVASVVAIGQMFEALAAVEPHAASWRLRDRRSVRRRMLESYIYAVTSALLDVALFVLALWALGSERDVVPRWTMLMLVVVACLLLILQVLATFVARAMALTATKWRPRPRLRS